MTRVKMTDARQALRSLVEGEVAQAAGKDGIVSKRDEAKLDPFLVQRASALRVEGGKGTRVRADALVARSVADAEAVWTKFNPPGTVDARFLSKGEVEQVASDTPALARLTRLAHVRAAGGSSPAEAKAAVEAFFATFAFAPDDLTGVRPLAAGLPGATVLDGRAPEVRAKLAPDVRRAFDVYARLEDADVGRAYLQRATIAGHEVHVVYAATDGDPSFLEVFDAKGKPLTSARLDGEQILAWDELFGRARFHPRVARLDQPKNEEGLSEPPEQAAAGQPPSDWPGALRLEQGTLAYAPDRGYRLTTLDVPALAGAPQRELATAALEFLWEESLKYRVVGGAEPFTLGMLNQGTLALGAWARPDGKTYEVAKWRDIDDGSYTLYFDRAEGQRLRLATVQFDN
jgi:hypothetical protein